MKVSHAMFFFGKLPIVAYVYLKIGYPWIPMDTPKMAEHICTLNKRWQTAPFFFKWWSDFVGYMPKSAGEKANWSTNQTCQAWLPKGNFHQIPLNSIMQQCSKRRFVGDYRHYTSQYIRGYHNSLGESLSTKQYEGTTQGFEHWLLTFINFINYIQ